jgi:hypothetical protein
VPRQRPRQSFPNPRAELAILALVRALRLGQHSPDLLVERRRAAVRVQRGVGLHLGAVQNRKAAPDQPGIGANPQHRREHCRGLIDMPLA